MIGKRKRKEKNKTESGNVNVVQMQKRQKGHQTMIYVRQVETFQNCRRRVGHLLWTSPHSWPGNTS